MLPVPTESHGGGEEDNSRIERTVGEDPSSSLLKRRSKVGDTRGGEGDAEGDSERRRLEVGAAAADEEVTRTDDGGRGEEGSTESARLRWSGCLGFGSPTLF